MHATAQHAARSPWVEKMARFGLVAQGVSFGLVAVLALKLAIGEGGEATDRQGALRTLAQSSFGKIVLVLLALGFAAYAVWRLVQAVFDRGGEGDDAKGLGKRAGYLGSGVIYAALTVSAVRILAGSGDSGGGQGEKKATAGVLGWTGGRWIVGAVGLAILGVGAWNAYRGVTKKFEKDLKTGEMSPTERTWAARIGTVGLLARAVVFAIIGWFLIKAAIEYDAKDAIGLDGALRKLVHASYGSWLLGLTAVGLLAFGVFCVIQARYRRV